MAFTSTRTGAQIDDVVTAGNNGTATASDTLLHSANTGVTSYSNTGPTGATEQIIFGATSALVQIGRPTTANVPQMIFVNPNGQVGSINTSGTTTAFLTSSDPRLKSEFIKFDSTKAWEKFDFIVASSGTFHFLSDPSKQVWGFNAHGIIDSGLDIGAEGQGPRNMSLGEVYGTKTVEDGEGKQIQVDLKVSPAGVDQSKVVPYLIAVIADLRNRLEALENLSV